MFIIILSTNINTKTNIITVFNDIFYVTFLVIRQRHGVDRNGRSGQILVFFLSTDMCVTPLQLPAIINTDV